MNTRRNLDIDDDHDHSDAPPAPAAATQAPDERAAWPLVSLAATPPPTSTPERLALDFGATFAREGDEMRRKMVRHIGLRGMLVGYLQEQTPAEQAAELRQRLHQRESDRAHPGRAIERERAKQAVGRLICDWNLSDLEVRSAHVTAQQQALTAGEWRGRPDHYGKAKDSADIAGVAIGEVHEHLEHHDIPNAAADLRLTALHAWQAIEAADAEARLEPTDVERTRDTLNKAARAVAYVHHGADLLAEYIRLSPSAGADRPDYPEQADRAAAAAAELLNENQEGDEPMAIGVALKIAECAATAAGAVRDEARLEVPNVGRVCQASLRAVDAANYAAEAIRRMAARPTPDGLDVLRRQYRERAREARNRVAQTFAHVLSEAHGSTVIPRFVASDATITSLVDDLLEAAASRAIAEQLAGRSDQ